MGGDRGRRAGGRTAHAARRRPVRRARRRDHRQRAVSRPRAGRRALHADADALFLRHARRLSRADQPLREEAPQHRPLNAHRRAGVQGRKARLLALLPGRGARRAQPRRVRHVARRARAGEPARASDHRHVRARAARDGDPQGPGAWAPAARRRARSGHQARARRARRRARHRHGLSRPAGAGAREARLQDRRRRRVSTAAPGRRPDAVG